MRAPMTHFVSSGVAYFDSRSPVPACNGAFHRHVAAELRRRTGLHYGPMKCVLCKGEAESGWTAECNGVFVCDDCVSVTEQP